MNRHVKVAGWLWIANGMLTIPMIIIGLVIINLNVPGSQDAMLVTAGVLCFGSLGFGVGRPHIVCSG